MYTLVKYLVVVAFGAWLGVTWLAPDQHTVYRYTPGETKTVTKTVSKPVATIPQACLDALHYSTESQRAASKIDTNADAGVALLGDARIAIIDNSIIKVNDVETKLRRIADSYSASIQTMSYNQSYYNRSIRKCHREIPK